MTSFVPVPGVVELVVGCDVPSVVGAFGRSLCLSERAINEQTILIRMPNKAWDT